MNAEELRITTMDPEHRVLGRSPWTTPRGRRDVRDLMGDDVEARRNFIQRNAKDVRFLDI
jgi:DNA gyrase subunit B